MIYGEEVLVELILAVCVSLIVVILLDYLMR